MTPPIPALKRRQIAVRLHVHARSLVLAEGGALRVRLFRS